MNPKRKREREREVICWHCFCQNKAQLSIIWKISPNLSPENKDTEVNACKEVAAPSQMAIQTNFSRWLFIWQHLSNKRVSERQKPYYIVWEKKTYLAYLDQVAFASIKQTPMDCDQIPASKLAATNFKRLKIFRELIQLVLFILDSISNLSLNIASINLSFY